MLKFTCFSLVGSTQWTMVSPQIPEHVGGLTIGFSVAAELQLTSLGSGPVVAACSAAIGSFRDAAESH